MGVQRIPAVRLSRAGPRQRLMQLPQAWLIAVVAGICGLIWIGVLLTAPSGRTFLFLPKDVTTGLEVPIACLWIVVGLVLLAFPDDLARDRLRWVAAGALVLGAGGFVLTYFLPLAINLTSFNTVLYGSWLTRAAAGTLMATGLWPASPPSCSRRVLGRALIGFALGLIGIIAISDRLPTLAHVGTLADAVQRFPLPLHAFTNWHWGLAILPLAAVAIAVLGAARHYPGRLLGGWLLIGLVGWGIAQLHDTFWPAAFSPIVTPADRLRLAFVAYITVGAMLEMQRVAVERAVLLAGERAASARLTEISHLREDFTAMVAHELGGPLGVVRRASELASLDPLSPAQTWALATIGREVELLEALVADVQLSAAVERDEFSIHPAPIAVTALLEDAADYMRILPGDHPITWPEPPALRVVADRERIAQILRNLLGNAAKYTTPDDPIEVRLTTMDDRLRIAISDGGPGIEPDELVHVFKKYGRGREAIGRRLPGVGLGLYLSRQIAQAHGGDLHVASTPGRGTTFWFDLEIADE